MRSTSTMANATNIAVRNAACINGDNLNLTLSALKDVLVRQFRLTNTGRNEYAVVGDSADRSFCRLGVLYDVRRKQNVGGLFTDCAAVWPGRICFRFNVWSGE